MRPIYRGVLPHGSLPGAVNDEFTIPYAGPAVTTSGPAGEEVLDPGDGGGGAGVEVAGAGRELPQGGAARNACWLLPLG
jgi:hypothetical protein